jgi:hypothetical protein
MAGDLEPFRSWFASESNRDTAEALWKLSGRFVRVRTDQSGNTALDYDNSFPDDVVPMLVLDASGQQRYVYELWRNRRLGLQFLPSPPKFPQNAGDDPDPPPLKWSDLRYVFDIKEDCNGKKAIQA